LVNAAPVRNTEGEIIAGVAVFPEITGLKKSEQRAREQREQLIQAAKMASLGTLVAGMAHEINNPNTFIMANAPVLQKIWQGLVPALEEHYQRHGHPEAGHLSWEEIKYLVPNLLGGITEGAKRVKSIVRSLKDYARQQPGDLNEVVNLNEVVESALTLLGNLVSKSTINFELSLQPDLPLFLGSRQRIEQVVMNLVVNACQALTSSDQAIKVSTDFVADPRMVTLVVQDGGSGISEKDLPHITDPFFTTKRDKRGTGLGLSITSSIVREHAGTMRFDSQPGQGTKVTVSMPVRDPASQLGAAGPHEESGTI
jgi:signal transduction histidine kinase